jgi:DNA-binding response OmpR family regulator
MQKRVIALRILVAEDDLALNEIIVKKLSAEGYAVDSCLNGLDALDYLQSVKYDAAILDIMMPEMDGLEAVGKLRGKGNLTPVIFLTARDTIADRVKGLDTGANDYLVKPFSFDELTARIRAMTRAASGNPTNVYSLGDLALDAETHIVKRAGREIPLTAREYALLEYLLRNKNKILSRQKIEDNVWNYDYEGGTNVVDVYITYLRRKIDDGHAVKLIHTVRGIGYCMKVEP